MGILDGILDAVGIGTGGIPWGSLISGVSGFLGQESANESNQQIAANNSAFNAEQAGLNRNFQAEQAQRQMDYQERMSGTSYQRAVPDMIKAGLNPMLAYSQGGASTPSGAAGGGSQASAVQPAPMQNSAGAGIAAAAQAAQVENTTAQTENIKADTDNKRSQNPNIQADLDRIREQANDLRAAIEKKGWESTKLREEAINLAQQWRNLQSQERLADSETEQAKARTQLIHIEKRLKELEIPGAQNLAAHETKYSGYRTDVGPFMGDVGKITNSADSARRAIGGVNRTTNIYPRR